jgi:adenine-specific DNA-methyltransferase
MDKLTKQDGSSLDMVVDKLEELKSIFPEAFTEDGVNFEVLRQLLGDTRHECEEKYGLTWYGKKKALQVALTPSLGTLRPCKEESVDWEKTQNLFIEGDNLEVLKLLQKSYANKVKMIYIDPPYNTGKEFIYPDKFQDNLYTYLKYTGQKDDEGFKVSSNTESSGRFHTNWLNMMYPRLRLAKTLLSDEGVIFISIDEHEQSNLRAICDEIFGIENLVACVSVINNMKGRNDKANVATAHEYLLVYSKGNYLSYGIPLTEEQLKEYKYKDENGERYALRDLRKRGRPDRREDRPNMFFPIFYDEATGICTLEKNSPLQVEITPKRGDLSDGRWRWGIDTVRTNLGILHPKYSKRKNRWDVQHRVYLNPAVLSDPIDEEADDDDNIQRTSKPKSFWWGGDISTDVASREFKRLFPGLNPDYPKSPYFIEKILHMGSQPGDLVLDFFAGYGTTAHSIFNLGKKSSNLRKFILVQLPERLEPSNNEQKETYKYCIENSIAPFMSDVCKERIRRAAAKIKDDISDYEGDLGFKVFKLDSSNIRAWNPDRNDLGQTIIDHMVHLVEDRSEEDVLYELLLKRGVDLTVPIEEKTIEGKTVYSIGYGVLFACLDTSISRDEVEDLAMGIMGWHTELKPEGNTQVVFRDSAFANDIAKTNMTVILEQHGIAHVRSL